MPAMLPSRPRFLPSRISSQDNNRRPNEGEEPVGPPNFVLYEHPYVSYYTPPILEADVDVESADVREEMVLKEYVDALLESGVISADALVEDDPQVEIAVLREQERKKEENIATISKLRKEAMEYESEIARLEMELEDVEVASALRRANEDTDDTGAEF